MKVFNDFLNENAINENAKEFIRDVLKMGSKDNLFDVYMQQVNMNPDDLSDFVKEVIIELKKQFL